MHGPYKRQSDNDAARLTGGLMDHSSDPYRAGERAFWMDEPNVVPPRFADDLDRSEWQRGWERAAMQASRDLRAGRKLLTHEGDVWAALTDAGEALRKVEKSGAWRQLSGELRDLARRSMQRVNVALAYVRDPHQAIEPPGDAG